MNKNAEQIFPEQGITQFGERLKLALGSESIRSFAKRCGLSDTMIRKYIRGEASPTIDNVLKMSVAASRSVSWFAGQEECFTPKEAEHSNVTGSLNDIIQNYMTEEEKCKAIELFRKGGLQALMPSVVKSLNESNPSIESVLGNSSLGRGDAAESTREQEEQAPLKHKDAG